MNLRNAKYSLMGAAGTLLSLTAFASAQDAAPAAEAAPAAAAAAPVLNSGDTAWMLISSVLVLMMIVPGLAPVLWRPRARQEHAFGG